MCGTAAIALRKVIDQELELDYIEFMASNMDLYFGLEEKERQIIKTACNAGDNPMTRQMLQLYMPKVTGKELTQLIKDIRALPS